MMRIQAHGATDQLLCTLGTPDVGKVVAGFHGDVRVVRIEFERAPDVIIGLVKLPLVEMAGTREANQACPRASPGSISTAFANISAARVAVSSKVFPLLCKSRPRDR
jgi:hypothetical protein